MILCSRPQTREMKSNAIAFVVIGPSAIFSQTVNSAKVLVIRL